MGTFYLDCELRNTQSAGRVLSVHKLLVDTGAEYSWIPETDLKKIGIVPRKKDIPFVMANGGQITRDIGYAIFRAGQFETVDEVVFGKPGDLKLLGARTLEGFAAVVDPRRKKLVAAGPLPAAGYTKSKCLETGVIDR